MELRFTLEAVKRCFFPVDVLKKNDAQESTLLKSAKQRIELHLRTDVLLRSTVVSSTSIVV